jgi:hypothetical protein
MTDNCKLCGNEIEPVCGTCLIEFVHILFEDPSQRLQGALKQLTMSDESTTKIKRPYTKKKGVDHGPSENSLRADQA